MFSSKAIEVVDTTGDSVAVNVSYRLELEGVPNSQARPRLGKYGFYNPNSRAKTAFKARFKSGISNVPIFDSDQPVVVKIKFFMRSPNTHFRGNDRLMTLKASLPL